jgi:hypothetical protein
MFAMVQKDQWIVLPFELVKELFDLRLSPVGVVPQHDRRPRIIVDYSFSGVNAETEKSAPAEAMQFGKALERIIRQIVLSDPRFGPVKFIKLDIADGFYRIRLLPEDIPKLGVVFPPSEEGVPLVAFPLSLPMGWTQSPPYFCAFTETIADEANARINQWRREAPHRLDQLADTTIPLPSQPLPATLHRPRDPLLPTHHRIKAFVDVFVDDFIAGAQGNTTRLQNIRRILMGAIDDVFRPLQSSDSKFRREPISTDKLEKGDGAWTTVKKLLGWVIDSVNMTITLPERRLARLEELLSSLPPTRKRISVKTWHQLLGELRSMSLALPGSSGLFGHLQDALNHREGNRLRLTRAFHDSVDDFKWIQQSLASRPTRLQELVPVNPTLVGAHDASGRGAGGVWFPSPTAVPRKTKVKMIGADGTLRRVVLKHPVPVVWRYRFPKEIQRQLTTFDNPRGSINNSELELAGKILQSEAGVQCYDVRERTLKSNTDNLATLFWSRKGSTTTASPAAYLLRLQAIHQRQHRFVSVSDYLEGGRNSMADDASRLEHLTDLEFLSHFNSTYPQETSWHLFTLDPALPSAVCMSLRRQTSSREWSQADPRPPRTTGSCGKNSATISSWTQPLSPTTTPSPSSKSLPTSSGTGLSMRPAGKYELAQWRISSAVLGKRLRQWGPATHA